MACESHRRCKSDGRRSATERGRIISSIYLGSTRHSCAGCSALKWTLGNQDLFPEVSAALLRLSVAAQRGQDMHATFPDDTSFLTVDTRPYGQSSTGWCLLTWRYNDCHRYLRARYQLRQPYLWWQNRFLCAPVIQVRPNIATGAKTCCLAIKWCCNPTILLDRQGQPAPW